MVNDHKPNYHDEIEKFDRFDRQYKHHDDNNFTGRPIIFLSLFWLD